MSKQDEDQDRTGTHDGPSGTTFGPRAPPSRDAADGCGGCWRRVGTRRSRRCGRTALRACWASSASSPTASCASGRCPAPARAPTSGAILASPSTARPSTRRRARRASGPARPRSPAGPSWSRQPTRRGAGGRELRRGHHRGRHHRPRRRGDQAGRRVVDARGRPPAGGTGLGPPGGQRQRPARADPGPGWSVLRTGVGDARPAPTAERLMRSRYTAFVLEDEAHLLRSWHPAVRPAEIRSCPARRGRGSGAGDGRAPRPRG